MNAKNNDTNTSIDLDINNYEYDDLLNLFKLSYDFDEQDLKNAKKIVLKMHPDKSNLGPEYFLFFSKAYKTIFSVYEFKNKSEKKGKLEDAKEYKEIINIIPKKGDENSRLLKKFIEENKYNDPKTFNKWFNNEFDKLNNDLTINGNVGHGSWLKSEEDISDEISVTKEAMGKEFSKRKKDLKSMIKYEGVQEMNAYNLGATALYGEEQEDNYSSDIFGSLMYQDVRKAHTETVIAVDEDDYESMHKFTNVDEYQRHRDNQSLSIKPLTEKESIKILSDTDKRKEEAATRRAYYYAKEVEKSKEKTNTFWAGLKQLANGNSSPV